jgi:hypothetical protein
VEPPAATGILTISTCKNAKEKNFLHDEIYLPKQRKTKPSDSLNSIRKQIFVYKGHKKRN